MEPYENLIVENFMDPDSSGIKADLDISLTSSEWPDVVVEALQEASRVGVPLTVFINPEGAANSLEGVISTPSIGSCHLLDRKLLKLIEKFPII
jgi:hypothetical protein